ncbi:MAG: DUF4388 domain-containing protein [Deltaproteobacteria bacterium]|nr:DUF4388 domain-containing protein [Deltaproteobacteria bacterium]
MSRPCILVVDNHPEDLRLLEVSLKNAGFAVTTASNGRDALRKVEINPPDLIISETALPELDGFAFVKALKDKPEWAPIPFLFLSEERSVEHKVRGLEQGVDDYLVKPVFVKELVARLRLILQRKKRESLEGRGAKTKFSGSLDDIGLVDLIQTVDLSKKTGALHLTRSGDRGVIYFQDGEVVDAEVGRHRGVAAVYRLLTWSEGFFDVDFRPVRRTRTIHLSSQEILMEGMRRLDEWGRLIEQLPPLDTIFMVDAGELIGRLDEIPDEVNAIIRLTDGTRSLLEIIDAAPFDDLETLKIITRLSFYGIFIETGRKGAPPPRSEFAYAKEVAGEAELDAEPATFGSADEPSLADQVARAAASPPPPSIPPPAPPESSGAAPQALADSPPPAAEEEPAPAAPIVTAEEPAPVAPPPMVTAEAAAPAVPPPVVTAKAPAPVSPPPMVTAEALELAVMASVPRPPAAPAAVESGPAETPPPAAETPAPKAVAEGVGKVPAAEPPPAEPSAAKAAREAAEPLPATEPPAAKPSAAKADAEVVAQAAAGEPPVPKAVAEAPGQAPAPVAVAAPSPLAGPAVPPPLIPPAGLRPPVTPTLPIIAAPPPRASDAGAGTEPRPGESSKPPMPLTFKLPPLPSSAAPPTAPAAPPSAAAAILGSKPDEKKPTTLRLLADAPPAGGTATAAAAPAAHASAPDPLSQKPAPTTLRLGPPVAPPPAAEGETRARHPTPAQLDALARQLEARSPFSGSGVSFPPPPPGFRLAEGETPPPGSITREQLEAEASAKPEGDAETPEGKVDIVFGDSEPKVIVDLPPEKAAEKATGKPERSRTPSVPPAERRAGGVVWGLLITLLVLAAGVYLLVRFRGGKGPGADAAADVQLAAAPELDAAPEPDAGSWIEPEAAAAFDAGGPAWAGETVPVPPGWDDLDAGSWAADFVEPPADASAATDALAEPDAAPIAVADAAPAEEAVALPACGDNVQAAKDLWRKRDRPGALDQLRAAVACDPTALEPRLQFVVWVGETPALYGDRDLCVEAAAVAQPAAEANPTNGRLWFYYVSVLYRSRQREAADAAKARCLAIRPRDEYSESCRFLPE